MSVKRIIMALLALVLIGGFIWVGATSLIKAQDEKLRYEKELQQKTLHVEKLETQEQKLKQEQIKAEQEKALQEQQLQESQKKQEELLQKQKELEAQLQAKLDTKNKIALASAKKSATATSVVAVSGSEITAIIINAANRFGINVAYALKIAKCESTYNPNAVNYNYIDKTTGTHPAGLFQHVQGYWAGRAAKYGYAGASVFDPVANANVTMAMWADGQQGLWECQ